MALQTYWCEAPKKNSCVFGKLAHAKACGPLFSISPIPLFSIKAPNVAVAAAL